MMKKKVATIILGAGLTLAVQAITSTTVFDFTTYSDGPLNGKDGWVGSTHYITNNALKMIETNEWNTAHQSGSFDSVTSVDEFTVSVEWSFTETTGTFNNKQFFNFLITDDTDGAGPVSFRPAVQKHNEVGEHQYAIRLFRPGGAEGPSYQNFDESRMGLDFDGGDVDSDRLRFTFSARRGANELDWTYVMSLDNVDTGMNCANSTGITQTDPPMFTTNEWWVLISNAQLATSSATDVKIYNMKVTQTTSDTIVQWGDMVGNAGSDKGLGAADIVTSPQAWTAQFGSYVVGTNHNPAVGSSYYPNNTGRSPIFNGALQAGNSSLAQVADNSGGDYLNIGANTTFFEAMVAWEVFLEPQEILTGLEMRVKAGSIDTNGYAHARFVIRKDGSWYASQTFNSLSDHFAWANSLFMAPDPAALTWYDFTPITDGAATIGSVAALSDLDGVDIVGFYGVFQDGENETWSNIQSSYFRATADADLTAWQNFVLLYDLGTEDKTANNDTDILNNWGEYVFGGNPTNGSDIGTQPYIDGAGDYHYVLQGDSTVTGRVVVTDSLTSISWTTNEVTIAPDSGTQESYISNLGLTTDEKFVKLLID